MPPVEYRRGSLHERLAVWDELKTLAADPGCLVIDPDSRLTQLGLLPVCDEDRYRLFESRRYGGASEDNLPALAAQWAHETLGIPNAAPYVARGADQVRRSCPHLPTSPSAWEWAKIPPSESPIPSKKKLLRLSQRGPRW